MVPDTFPILLSERSFPISSGAARPELGKTAASAPDQNVPVPAWQATADRADTAGQGRRAPAQPPQTSKHRQPQRQGSQHPGGITASLLRTRGQPYDVLFHTRSLSIVDTHRPAPVVLWRRFPPGFARFSTGLSAGSVLRDGEDGFLSTISPHSAASSTLSLVLDWKTMNVVRNSNHDVSTIRHFSTS